MDAVDQPKRDVRVSSRLFFGLSIIVIGVFFLLGNLGYLKAEDIVGTYWPTLLILYGLIRLASGGAVADRLWGIVWIVFGGWIQLVHLGYLHMSPWQLWPLFLVMLGLRMVFRSVGGMRQPGAWVDSGDRLSAFALMSGVDRKYTSKSFLGGDATALMGGCEIDLRQTQLTGGQIVVDLFAFWGGIDLYVPGDWTLRNEVLAILGGVEDSRKQTGADPNKVLVIRGAAIMGGIEIKN
jgi:hypothetical protein